MQSPSWILEGKTMQRNHSGSVARLQITNDVNMDEVVLTCDYAYLSTNSQTSYCATWKK